MCGNATPLTSGSIVPTVLEGPPVPVSTQIGRIARNLPVITKPLCREQVNLFDTSARANLYGRLCKYLISFDYLKKSFIVRRKSPAVDPID